MLTYFIVCSSFLVVHLLPREDETLLWWRNTFLLFHSLLKRQHKILKLSKTMESCLIIDQTITHLDSLNLVSRLDVNLDFLPSQSLHLDKHRV